MREEKQEFESRLDELRSGIHYTRLPKTEDEFQFMLTQHKIETQNLELLTDEELEKIGLLKYSDRLDEVQKVLEKLLFEIGDRGFDGKSSPDKEIFLGYEPENDFEREMKEWILTDQEEITASYIPQPWKRDER